MNNRSPVLQKLYTLEELSMAFWETEKIRMSNGLPEEERKMMAGLGEKLHELESLLMRKQGKELLSSFPRAYQELLVLMDHYREQGLGGDSQDPRFDRLCTTLAATIEQLRDQAK